MRFGPKSLVGQVALLLGIALLVAQLINFGLILNERQKASLAQNQGPAITRFVTVAVDLNQAAPDFRQAVIEDSSRRGAHYSIERLSQNPATAREAAIEERLAADLAKSGVRPTAVRAVFADDLSRPASRGSRRSRTLILSLQRTDGSWLVGKLPTPLPDPWLPARLGAATLLLYLIVLGASLLIAWRLVGPLSDLARVADRFKGRGIPETVVPRGPTDLRRAIEAFNGMNGRVAALLSEKDVMLGAIGHDLRTPLASLRIRAESVKPASESRRMIATIEQMAAILEDILTLARTGRTEEQSKTIDLNALVADIAKEYCAGGQEVRFLDGAAALATVQPNLIRRAVRNLIDNAVKYGGSAELQVTAADDRATIVVRDRGPGLPDSQLEGVTEPFVRMDGSRHRNLGGSGLGLAIARAVAQSHGGNLQLANRSEGGLSATLSVLRGRG